MLITTALSTPQPANSGLYRLALDGVSAAFDAKRAALQQLVDVARATLDQLLTDVKNQLPLTAFDPDPIDFGEDDAEIARFRTQVRETLKLIVDDTTKRLTQVDTMLVQHDASAASEQRVKLLQQAARLLFGEDFQLVPSIALPQAALDEVENAYLYSQSGGLTNYLTTSAGRDFPMDDWLHGVARVREKMYHWENVVLLDNAVRPDRPVELTPLQLPHYPNEAWLGLETPPNQVVDGERLLYTAHFAEPFDRTKPIRGLLVDEWTEVIPGATEETGIAFHYDRPNCEPPQTWLVALPASFTGSWSWDDLVDAVLDALDSARRRALEPAHLDSTAYSFFLPATTSAYTFPEISISNNLLRNRRIYAVEKG
jgi:hypothetical protein